MFLEILTPERVLFSGDVISIKLPGVSGDLQLLENHAPIATTFCKGVLSFQTKGLEPTSLKSLPEEFKNIDGAGKLIELPINFGSLEMKANKATVLIG